MRTRLLLCMMAGLLLAGPAWADRDLKEDTAVTKIIGPFIDSAGVDAETALTVANIDCNLYKNDATKVDVTLAASGTDNDCVHVEDGYYSLELTATDTSTPGYLRITFSIAGVLIFHEDFNVLPANIYDSKYSTDKLQVDVVQCLGTAITADDAGIPNVNLVSIDGEDTDGNNATLNLKALNITNDDGPGVYIGGTTYGIQISASEYGLDIAGATRGMNISSASGDALYIASAGGVGVVVISNHATSPGMTITGNTTGAGLVVTGGADSGAGAVFQGGATNGAGVTITGDGTGPGLAVTGGDDSGAGATILGGATNGIGMSITGDGTGDALDITGGDGASSIAIDINAGSTAGVAIDIDTTSGTAVAITAGSGTALLITSSAGDGHGVQIAGDGSGEGVLIEAGPTGHGLMVASATGDAIHAVAQTLGHGMNLIGAGEARYDLNADIQGALSGAVGSVAGNVDGNVTGSVGDLLKISGDATAANNLELAFDGTGFGFTNCTMPTVTTTGTATAVTTVNGLAANVITAAAINDAAIDNATFAADVGTTVYASNHIALATRKALDDYDPPTDTEMLAAHTTTDALINGIDDNPWDAGARTLTAATNLTALITDYNLDHLVKSAVDTNLQTTVHDNSVIGYMLASANVSAFVRTDDSLQALEGGIAGVADPWSTALPGAYAVGTAGYILGTNLDATITDRTLAAADYFLFGSDTVVNVTAVATLTGHTVQTGDSYAIVNNGTYGNSALKTLVDGIDDNAWDDAARTLTALDEDDTAIDLDGSTIGTVTTLTGHTVQTGDSFARLGAPAGASVSADIAAAKVDTAAILVDTGTTLDDHLTDIKGAGWAAANHALDIMGNRIRLLQAN